MKKIFGSIACRIWMIVGSILAAFIIVFNVLATGMLFDLLALVFGRSKPIYADGVTAMYIPETQGKKEAYDNAANTNIEACKEGFVLLKNKNNALPVAKGSKVSIFGKNSVNLAYSGGGSGSFIVDPNSQTYKDLSGMGIDIGYKDLYAALGDTYSLNPTLREFYENDSLSGAKRSNANTDLDSGDDMAFTVGETPRANYTKDVKNSYGQYNDLALVVITRVGGEGCDLPRHQGSSAGAVSADSHYLELDQNEIDMLTDVCNAGFKKVCVLFNIPSAMEANFLYDTTNFPFADKIDSALWIGYTGKQGTMALPDILTGAVSPSGKTVDTWATDFLKTPSSINFGTGIQQTPVSKNQTFDQYNEGLYYFVNYEEGIYVGYRYFETRGLTDGESWYKNNVVYPFGYGLSYTNFEWNVKQPSSLTLNANQKFTVEVEVTNTGKVAGKDVVQIYASAPYTKGGIEKAHKVLVGFAKTDLIAPNGKDTVTVEIDPYSFASYDYSDANKNGFSGYELERGLYTFYVSTDAHNSVKSFEMTLANDFKYEVDPVTGETVGNRFTKLNSVTDVDLTNVSDVHSSLDTILSRSDWEGTWPTANTDANRTAGSALMKELKNSEVNNPIDYDSEYDFPEFDLDVIYTIRDLLPKETPEETYLSIVDYNDERWEDILNACNVDNLIDIYNHAAYQTKVFENIGMPGTLQADGPSGFTCFLNKDIISGTNQYCSEPVLAATFNIDLIEKLGKAMGEEGLWGYYATSQPYSAIYAPGANIHRSLFGGRCSEYMSEDPFLTGKIAAAEIRGMQKKGLLPAMKHFVANEQETHRSIGGDCSWMTEQALREIYLKPFEIAVKEADCRGVMSSFNRVGSVWTGGDYRLLTEILRNEWGFRGSVICDFNTCPKYMYGNQMAYAGGDINLQTTGGGYFNCDDTSTGDTVVLRQAAKNILYALANTNAMNGEVIGWEEPAWINIMHIASIAAGVAIVGWGAAVIVLALKKK